MEKKKIHNLLFTPILSKCKYESFKKSELDANLIFDIKRYLDTFKKTVKTLKKKCKIINIGSIYGSMSPDFRIYDKKDNFNSEIYGASKAGIIQITKYLAVLMSNYNINVNCMSPGGILDDRKKQNTNFVKKYSKRIPLNRMAKSDDFFTCILFLASDSSSYVTGQNIIVDGGLSAW